MVKIGEEHKGCRFWGYEPASGEMQNAIVTLGRDKIISLREQYKREREMIKARDMKPIKYGMSKIAAHNEAEHIENQTGVNMRIFNHDYM